MISKEGDDIAKIQIGTDVILELSTEIVNGEEQLKMDAEYPEEKYTEQEIQDIANDFMEGLIDSIRSKSAIDADPNAQPGAPTGAIEDDNNKDNIK